MIFMHFKGTRNHTITTRKQNCSNIFTFHLNDRLDFNDIVH